MQSITIKSDKPVVLIPIGQYESTKETIELLSRHPNLTEEFRQERRKIDTGDYISFEDFKVKYIAK